MATTAQWVAGARVRTLPNSIAPVIVGAGAAAAIEEFSWWASLLALVVSLALQVGVNYANDYSDGIRGTDDKRVGPLRLVASGVAPAAAVRLAAFVCFGVAGVAGVVLIALTGHWWLVTVGVVSVAAAWFYTGGPKPYGYAGWGEVAVFVFFGPVAVLGTQYVQTGQLTWLGVAGAVALGCISASVLVTNNLRDLPTDSATGKITMAVRLGDRKTRRLYVVLVAVPFVVSVVAAVWHPWLLLGLLAGVLAAPAVRRVTSGATGLALIPALRDTSFAMLLWAVLTAVGLAV
jgi:1,4-dihydroxy-2-naphthoate octaprenyltransferase